jgi:hypothetical protein
MQLELRVKAHCAAAGRVLLAVREMSAIATQAIVRPTAAAPSGHQQQQQQADVQQYLAAELVVKSHCAAHPDVFAAVNDMSIIALAALTRGAQL